MNIIKLETSSKLYILLIILIDSFSKTEGIQTDIVTTNETSTHAARL